MSSYPMVTVTETTFAISNWEQWSRSPDMPAMIAWCEQHGIDADTIPSDAVIVRDVDAKTIQYVEVVVDRNLDGARTVGEVYHRNVVKQLTNPPAPWPDVVSGHIGERWRTDHEEKARAEERERIALAIEEVANSEDYVWVSTRQALNHAATIARQEPDA